MWSIFVKGIGRFQWFDFVLAAVVVGYLIFVIIGICEILYWQFRKYVWKNVQVEENMARDTQRMKLNDSAYLITGLALACIIILARHF